LRTFDLRFVSSGPRAAVARKQRTPRRGRGGAAGRTSGADPGKSLSGYSNRLKLEVGKFLATVRAA
jgi:hypothetical protein